MATQTKLEYRKNYGEFMIILNAKEILRNISKLEDIIQEKSKKNKRKKKNKINYKQLKKKKSA